MNYFAQRIMAGVGSNLTGLAAKGDEGALAQLPDLLVQRGGDAQRYLESQAQAIKSLTRRGKTKEAAAIAKSLLPLMKAIEG